MRHAQTRVALAPIVVAMTLAAAVAIGCGGSVEFSDQTSAASSAGAGAGGGTGPDGSGDSQGARPAGTQGGDAGKNGGATPGVDGDKSRGDGPESVERRFNVSDRKTGELAFTPSLGILTQDVTLVSAYDATKKAYTQRTRTPVMKSFQQGAPGASHEETFTQENAGLLDLVLVVDNSGSMAEEQSNLSTKLAPLLEPLNGADWRINVLTTDEAGGCSRKLLKKGDANLATKFADAVNAGIAGNGTEKGILMAVKGLNCPTVDWVRKDSTIAVLIVADEDNCSNGTCTGKAYNGADYLLDHLTKTMGRKLGVDARVYGIYWVPGTVCETGAHQASIYEDAVKRSSGKAGSICDADYTTTLTAISTDVATILKAQFTLAAAPDADSLSVSINGTLLASGFSVNGKTLTFDPKPAQGATINVKYTTGARPEVQRWSLGEVPASGTLAVTVNGAALAAAAFSVDVAAKELVLQTKPAANAEIAAIFRRDEPLQSSFSLGAIARGGQVAVTINGNATTAFTYELQSSGTASIAFPSPPTDGATVTTTFDALREKTLTYSLPLAGSNLRTITVTDAATAAAVQATLADKTLTIDASEHLEGRKLRVTYRNEHSGHLTLTLPETPDAGSVELATEGVACYEGSGIAITGKTITIACDFSTATEHKITYAYRTPARSSFTMSEVTTPDVGSWSAFINDKATKDFTRTDATITITAPLGTGDVIRISYTRTGT